MFRRRSRNIRNISRILTNVPASQVKRIVTSFESEGAGEVIAEKDPEGNYKVTALFDEEILGKKVYHAH